MNNAIQVFTGELASQTHALTTSRIVARVFDKQHKNVIQATDNLECSEDFRRLNFQPTSYIDVQGRQQPEYHMTRDGFMFLAMGFTGSEAARWKEGFIEAFNALEAERAQRCTAQTAAMLAAAQKTALKAYPLWKRIARYKALGLSHVDIGRLLQTGVRRICVEVRQMERAGIISPPPNLAALRAGARRLRSRQADTRQGALL